MVAAISTEKSPLFINTGSQRLSGYTIAVTKEPSLQSCSTFGSVAGLLPSELLHDVFSHLAPHDYDSARLVCRRWFDASLSKKLLVQQIRTLRTSTSTKGRDVTEEEIESIRSLRIAFAVELEKWPGSRRRVACGRMALGVERLLRRVEKEWGYDEHPRKLTTMAFSGKAGTFVGIVTEGKKSNGNAERKLWVHRLFSFRHSTFGYKPRGTHGELCDRDVEVSRCAPGQLYMTVELPGTTPILDIALEEHPIFSAVREIKIRYITGKEEVMTFRAFRPVRQNIQNHLGDEKTLYIDKRGITYKTWNCKCASKSSAEPTSIYRKVKNRFGRSLIPCARHPSSKAAMEPKTERILVETAPDAPRQICQSISIPHKLDGSRYSLIVTPAQEILLTRPSTSSDSLITRYRLVPPPRVSDVEPPQIRHVTIAPRYFYDFGCQTWRACIAASYSNGEVWMWCIDISDLELATSTQAAEPATPIYSPDAYGPRILPSIAMAVAQESRLAIQQKLRRESSPSKKWFKWGDRFGATNSENPFTQFPGEYVPGFSTTATLSLGGMSPGVKQIFDLRRVKLDFEEEIDDIQARRLGWTEDLILKMNFVGRGQTLLIGTAKEVEVVEFRVRDGWERGTLKAKF